MRRGRETCRVTVVPAGGGGAATTVVAADGVDGERAAQVGDELRAAGVPLLGALREPACEDGVERGRQARVDLARRGRRFGRVRVRLGRRVVTHEGPPTGQELERDAGQRVPVAGGRGRLAARLLRRHVAGRAEHGPGEGQGVVPGRAGDAEVGDADRVVVGDEQVGGLHVAMDDPAGVRAVECRRRLLEPAQRLLGVDAAGAQPVGDRPAGDVLHHDERQVVPRLPHVVDHDHVRLAREARGGLRLAQEPRVELVVPGVALGEHLHGDRPPERLVGRPVDLPHAPVRDQLRRRVPGRKRRPRRRHWPIVPGPGDLESRPARLAYRTVRSRRRCPRPTRPARR